MRETSDALEQVEQKEAAIAGRFEALKSTDTEQTEAMQGEIDALKAEFHEAISAHLVFLRRKQTHGNRRAPRAWIPVWQALFKLQSAVRDKLGQNYLLGNIVLDESTDTIQNPISMSFNVYRAGIAQGQSYHINTRALSDTVQIIMTMDLPGEEVKITETIIEVNANNFVETLKMMEGEEAD